MQEPEFSPEEPAAIEPMEPLSPMGGEAPSEP